MKGWDF